MHTSARLSGFTGTASFAVTLQLLLRRPAFSVAPEKVGKKMRRRRVILRADAREFLAAPRPERPVGRKADTFPIAFGADKCTTRSYRWTDAISLLLISGILGQPQLALHCRGGRLCPPCRVPISFTDDGGRKFSETNVCIFFANVID